MDSQNSCTFDFSYPGLAYRMTAPEHTEGCKAWKREQEGYGVGCACQDMKQFLPGRHTILMLGVMRLHLKQIWFKEKNIRKVKSILDLSGDIIWLFEYIVWNIKSYNMRFHRYKIKKLECE